MPSSTLCYNDILALDKVTRLNLINSLPGYKSANLIGTISENGIENLAIISSVIHLSSNPPVLGFIVRPTVTPRHTYSNLKETEYCTINSVSEGIIDGAHQTSGKYPEEISEFEACGLTPFYSDQFSVPYVKESPVKIGMKYSEEHEIKLNGVILIAGTIVEVLIDENFISNDGFVDHSQISNVALGGLDAYYKTSIIKRKEYVRVK